MSIPFDDEKRALLPRVEKTIISSDPLIFLVRTKDATSLSFH